MNKIKNEILFFFSRKFLFSQLIVIQLVICFTICMFSICFQENSKAGTKKFNTKYNEKKYYQLTDHFIGENEDFLKSDDALQKLKLFYQRLKSSDCFTYAEIYEQSISFKDFKGSDMFYDGYQYGKIRKDGDLSSLNALWCGYDAADIFDFDIESGSWFDEKEINKPYVSQIPVILGNSYKELYKTGDIIYGEAMTDCEYGNNTFKVIGFLKPGTTVVSRYQFVNLDHFIIMPMNNDLSIAESESERAIIEYFYLMKTSGEIVSQNSAEYVQKHINDICQELNIHPYYMVVNAENQQVSFVYADIQQCNSILAVMSVILILFACVILTIFEIISIKQNLKYFSILLISGFKYNDILKILFGQTIIFQLEALFFSVCALIISCKFVDIHIYFRCFIIVIAVSFFVTVISVFISYIKFLKYDLTEYLRKR